jgi:hypothetical protein
MWLVQLAVWLAQLAAVVGAAGRGGWRSWPVWLAQLAAATPVRHHGGMTSTPTSGPRRRRRGKRPGGHQATGQPAAGQSAAGDRGAGDRGAGERGAGDRAAGERSAGERADGRQQPPGKSAEVDAAPTVGSTQSARQSKSRQRQGEQDAGRDTDRHWRDLTANSPSQVGVGGALRARDVARPGPEEIAAAERDVVLVRRQWQPTEELNQRPR